jgi:hypothetical protein
MSAALFTNFYKTGGQLSGNVVVRGFLTNSAAQQKTPQRALGGKSGGDRIRTCDLEVMSLASYRAAPPRDML